MLQQMLSMKSVSGKAALQGKIVHQVLEWMAKLKKRGKTHIGHMWLLERAWDMHVSANPNVEIRRITSRGEAADFKKCRLCLEAVLADDFYNPYKLKVIGVEKWFRIEMPGEEWKVGDEQFRVRGYIDLVHEISEDTLEIIDWKTGKREDFYTRRKIDAIELMSMVQSRLYHLAGTQVYSKYKNILITFYYMEDGGPITISFNCQDITMTIAAIWKFFKAAKTSLVLRNRSWKCRMCPFNKDDVCQKVWSDFVCFGSDYLQDKYGQEEKKE
jgi:hypothetical protein